MKATVLESSEGRSVVLAEDGLFYSIEGSYQTGEKIEYEKRADAGRYALRRKAMLKKAAAAAACLILLLSGAFYSYQNLMVYADVTVDGAMPVKLSLNRKHEVIRIEAVSEDGDDLARDMNENGMKGKTIGTAVGYAEKYIEEHSDAASARKTIITVDCRNETEKNRMEETLNKKYGGTDESVKGDDSGGDNGKNPSEKGTPNESAGSSAGTDGGNKAGKEPAGAGKEAPERGSAAGTDDTGAPAPPDTGGGQNGSPHDDPPKQQ